MQDIFILGGARTALGSFGGALSNVPVLDLAGLVGRAAVNRAGIDPNLIAHSVFGVVSTSAPNDLYLSRVAAIRAGAPASVSALNVSQLCGSGLQAVVNGWQALATRQCDIALVGGAETISRTPHLLTQARFGKKIGDADLVDLLDAALTCPFGSGKLGYTAERLAQEFSVSRADQDQFAAQSHAKALHAIQQGRFETQIVPVPVQPQGLPQDFVTDEQPRRASLGMLGRLPAAFAPQGTVTAGNSAALTDGAAALVLAHEAALTGSRAVPLARILGTAQCGVDAARMGYGPVPAVRKLCTQFGLHVDDFDVIELNEAFAVQALVGMRELGLDPARVNPNGGAVALGHPVGATGAILVVKALYELQRTGGKRALVAMCVGGGQGIAVALERI